MKDAPKMVYCSTSPGISKIIEIDSDIGTEIEEARRWIYGAEKGEYSLADAYEIIEGIAGYEIINEYKQKSGESAKGYDRRTSRGKSQSDTYHANFMQERSRRAREIINSVNTEKTMLNDAPKMVCCSTEVARYDIFRQRLKKGKKGYAFSANHIFLFEMISNEKFIVTNIDDIENVRDKYDEWKRQQDANASNTSIGLDGVFKEASDWNSSIVT